MRPMLRDPGLDAAFAADGFLHLPLLDPEEVRLLADVIEEIRVPEIKGIYTNLLLTSRADNLRFHTAISGVLRRHVDALFLDCYVAGSMFFVKGDDSGSECQLHQDWNNVDERSFTSCSVWCPLVDVHAGNGALEVIKGSHRWFDLVRSITLPAAHFALDADLDPYLHRIDARAGEVVIFAHNLFHGSRRNTAGVVRPAAVAGVIPREADHLHFYKDPRVPDAPLEMLRIDHNFYFEDLACKHREDRPPGLTCLGSYPYVHRKLQKADILRAAAAQRS